MLSAAVAKGQFLCVNLRSCHASKPRVQKDRVRTRRALGLEETLATDCHLDGRREERTGGQSGGQVQLGAVLLICPAAGQDLSESASLSCCGTSCVEQQRQLRCAPLIPRAKIHSSHLFVPLAPRALWTGVCRVRRTVLFSPGGEEDIFTRQDGG